MVLGTPVILFLNDKYAMRLVELFDSPPITLGQLKNLERGLDILFHKLDIDVDITNQHFYQRVNDPRNGDQVTLTELVKLFKQTYTKYGDRIKRLDHGDQAVLTDLATKLNIPIIMTHSQRNNMDHMHAKTIIRKPNLAAEGKPKLFLNTNNDD